MDIELNRLSAQETPVRGEVRVSDADGRLREDGLAFPTPFLIDAVARRDATGLVRVTGRVTGELSLQCGRCLALRPLAIDVDFESRFAESRPASRGARQGEAAGAEVELGSLDMDVSFLAHGAKVLPVQDIVREQVLLEVPLRPLCSPDCAGLCQHCGADLNAADCGCPDVEPAAPERLHGLRDHETRKPAKGGDDKS